MVNFDYTWNGVNNTSLVWFNEGSLHLAGPVVVVEGQFDALRVAKVWPKVVATLTARPTPAKLDRLLQSSALIHLPDTDQAGQQSKAVYQRFCALNSLSYYAIDLPSEVKDPGDCHPDFLRSAIQEVVDSL